MIADTYLSSLSAGGVGVAKTVMNATLGYTDTYGLATVLVLVQAEITATIAAACVPFCRPILRKIRPSRKGEIHDPEAGVGPGPRPVPLAMDVLQARRQSKGHARLGSDGDFDTQQTTSKDEDSVAILVVESGGQ